MSDLKLEVGARVRLVKDIVGEAPDSSEYQPPRVYAHKGWVGIVQSITDPATLSGDDEYPIEVKWDRDGYSEDFVEESDIEVITSAEDVAKEPREFTITGQLVVEVTHRIKANSREEAAKTFREMGSDLLDDWDEMEVKKVKKLDPFNIGEKGYDY